jgi:hypothetical protein
MPRGFQLCAALNADVNPDGLTANCYFCSVAALKNMNVRDLVNLTETMQQNTAMYDEIKRLFSDAGFDADAFILRGFNVAQVGAGEFCSATEMKALLSSPRQAEPHPLSSCRVPCLSGFDEKRHASLFSLPFAHFVAGVPVGKGCLTKNRVLKDKLVALLGEFNRFDQSAVNPAVGVDLLRRSNSRKAGNDVAQAKLRIVGVGHDVPRLVFLFACADLPGGVNG